MEGSAIFAAPIEALLALEVAVLSRFLHILLYHRDDALVVVQLRFIERRVAVRVLVARVDPFLEKSLHDVDVADRCSLQHRSIAVLVSDIQVRALLDKELEQRHVVHNDGVVQQRVPAVNIDRIVNS